MDLCGLCLRHRWQWLLKAADKLPANDTDSLCKILALLPLSVVPALACQFSPFCYFGWHREYSCEGYSGKNVVLVDSSQCGNQD